MAVNLPPVPNSPLEENHIWRNWFTRIREYIIDTRQGYTVATLPLGEQGDRTFVTDALSPTYLTPVVGGGVVVCPVFYNGTTWITY